MQGEPAAAQQVLWSQTYGTPAIDAATAIAIGAAGPWVIAGNTDGLLIHVLTWVPVWTPFAVLARLGLGIPTWEVIATATTLAAFTALELVFLGRLFRASLLAQGQRPKLADMLSRMRVAPE